MTDLKKPIRRSTTLLLDNRQQARERDRITVTLYPDNTIGFRAHKRRTEYRLPLAVVYKLAIVEQGKERDRQRQAARRIKRGVLR